MSAVELHLLPENEMERVEHWRSLVAQSQGETPQSKVKPEARRDS